MKIGVAQIRPIEGDVEKNIQLHLGLIHLAITAKTDALFFPELSITGYNRQMANDLKVSADDERFTPFQTIADEHEITTGIGAPSIGEDGVYISMIIFSPQKNPEVYSKQYLYDDELDYFIEGHHQTIIDIRGQKMAPAICYESSKIEHLKKAIDLGADVYVASVARTDKNVVIADEYYKKVSSENNIPILMSNSVGSQDNFIAAGQSGIWNNGGTRIAQLNQTEEGILIFDTENNSVIKLVKP